MNSVKLQLSRNATFLQAVERIGAAGGDLGPGTGIAAFCAGKARWAGSQSVSDALQHGATSVLRQHSDRNLRNLTATSRGKS